ncbi:MAG: PAS domain S-box protein [Candidatus Melainabacteria bacterium]|mgnify:CR=1 FL=1|nr:PAS domain S-box protein [Candidatus Melainabacteria bacterium]
MFILLGTFALLQTIFLSSVGWAVIETSEQLEKARRVKLVVSTLSRLSNLTQELTLGVLNVVGSPDAVTDDLQGWASDYNRVANQFSKELAQLKRSLKSYPETRKELDELVDSYQVGIDLMNRLKSELNFDTHKHYFLLYKLQEASNLTTEQLEKLESKFGHIEESTSDELQAQSEWLFKIALSLGVIVNITAAYLLYRFFVIKELGRLQVVADNTINLALEKPLAAPVFGDDEIAELDRSIRDLSYVLDDYKSKERTILENAAEFICSINNKGIFTAVTQASSALWGYNRDEIIGRRISSLIHPDETADTLAAIDTLFNERIPISFENTVRQKDGSDVEVVWSAQPGEEFDTVVMIAHDITERNRVNRLIRESEEQFRTIIDSVPATVLTLSNGFQIRAANPTTTKMFQYQPGELLGKDFSMLFTGSATQHAEDASIVKAAQTHAIELQALRKDLTPIAVSLNVNRFVNHGKDNFLAVLQDITTRREIELVKRDFISMISHDLRSPLTSLHGTLGMMSAQIQAVESDDKRHKLEYEILLESESRIGKLVNLINDFLDLEKIESGSFAFETNEVTVLKLVSTAAEQLNEALPDSERTLKYDTQDSASKVRVDLDRIVMALLSFVSAIIRFSPRTSAAIVTSEKLPGRVSIFVTAEGCSIPQETRESCLQRYAIVELGQHETWTVSGLSLALARATIEAHQGSLVIETREGRDGFNFTLPG